MVTCHPGTKRARARAMANYLKTKKRRAQQLQKKEQESTRRSKKSDHASYSKIR